MGRDQMTAPSAGSDIQIKSYKHDGHLHRVWESTIVLKGTEQVIIGANDKTLVVESDGRTWITREPAICYFHAKHWFNVIGMLRNDGIHYYCNVSSPYVYDTEAIKYIDYDLDIRVYPNGRIVILDQKEFIDNAEKMNYSEDIKRIVNHAITELKLRIKDKLPPFDKVSANLNLDAFQKILEHQQVLKETKNNLRKGKLDK